MERWPGQPLLSHHALFGWATASVALLGTSLGKWCVIWGCPCWKPPSKGVCIVGGLPVPLSSLKRMFFSSQIVSSQFVMVQTVSLGVGFKELKGLGFFLPFPKWIKMQIIVLLLGHASHHGNANWKLSFTRISCCGLQTCSAYVAFLFFFFSRNSHLAFTVLSFLPPLDKLDSTEMLTTTKVMCLDFALLQNAVFLKALKITCLTLLKIKIP